MPARERWLFPGRRPGQHLTTRQLCRLFHKTAKAAGITKPVSLHSLRDSFATHLLKEDPERERQQSVELARRAIRTSGNDPYVLGEEAYVIGYFESNIDPAIVLIDRSLELNPSSALAWFRSGWLRLWAGQIDLGIQHFENSRRCNPLRPAPPSFGIAVGHFFARRLERAVVMLRLSLQENPTWPPSYRFLASCCAHLGHLDEARAIVKRLRDITPSVIPGAEHWRVPEQREFFLEGLRLAAGEAK